MLEVQRQRHTEARHSSAFARRFVIAHCLLGLAAVALLLFHELFAWSLGTAIWYVVSVGLSLGMAAGLTLCRMLLASAFLAAAAFGIYFAAQVFPNLPVPSRAPTLSRHWLPLWVGLFNVAYGSGGLLCLLHPKIRKAARLGFELW